GAASDVRYGWQDGDILRVGLGLLEFIPVSKILGLFGDGIRLLPGTSFFDDIAQFGRRHWDEFLDLFRRGCSFSADTQVLTPDGTKAISDIQVGDLVLGYNEEDESIQSFLVTAAFTQLHDKTLDVTIDGEVIHTTDEHPFLVV